MTSTITRQSEAHFFEINTTFCNDNNIGVFC